MQVSDGTWSILTVHGPHFMQCRCIIHAAYNVSQIGLQSTQFNTRSSPYSIRGLHPIQYEVFTPSNKEVFTPSNRGLHPNHYAVYICSDGATGRVHISSNRNVALQRCLMLIVIAIRDINSYKLTSTW